MLLKRLMILGLLTAITGCSGRIPLPGGQEVNASIGVGPQQPAAADPAVVATKLEQQKANLEQAKKNQEIAQEISRAKQDMAQEIRNQRAHEGTLKAIRDAQFAPRKVADSSIAKADPKAETASSQKTSAPTKAKTVYEERYDFLVGRETMLYGVISCRGHTKWMPISEFNRKPVRGYSLRWQFPDGEVWIKVVW